MQGAETGHIGPYELRGELGRGAMARVWRAWDPSLEREVAIKEPLVDPRLPEATIQEMNERFVAEARAAARLTHPGIVTIYAASVWDGRPAIVMELIKGETLSALLNRGPLGEAAVLDILCQLLDAVGYAHQHGVVHRDIKPDNIFVTVDGVVKLADFGIAHVDHESSVRLTSVGSVLGTPGYMSPEQAVGNPVDLRSDLFSIGVVAYEMLVGRNPFGPAGDTTALLYRIVHEQVPELAEVVPGIDPHVAAAIMAALAKNPADRPQSAREFRAMLEGQGGRYVQRGVYHTPVGDEPPVQHEQVRSAPSLVPYLVVAAVALVLLATLMANALGGVGGGGSSSQGADTEMAQDTDADDGADTEEAADAQETGDVTDAAAVPQRESLSDYSWDELAVVAEKIAAAADREEALEVAKSYGLVDENEKLQGETKDVTLNDGTTAAVRIVGFYHDDRTDGAGKTGITFEFADVPTTHRMNPASDNGGGWASSELRAWLDEEFFSLLPEEVSSHIVTVEKLTNNAGCVEEESDDTSMVTATSDRVWLLSSTEVFGTFSSEYYMEGVYNAEGTQYQLYSDQGVFKDYAPGNGSFSFCRKDGAYSWWWLRSPVVREHEFFDDIAADGDWDKREASLSGGIAPCFCF